MKSFRFHFEIFENSLIGESYQHNFHCMKSVHIRSSPGLYFPALKLNMERYFEPEKIRTRKTPNTDTF